MKTTLGINITFEIYVFAIKISKIERILYLCRRSYHFLQMWSMLSVLPICVLWLLHWKCYGSMAYRNCSKYAGLEKKLHLVRAQRYLSFCSIQCDFWTVIKTIFFIVSLEALMAVQFVFTVMLCWSSWRGRLVTLCVRFNGYFLSTTEERALSASLFGIMGMCINTLNSINERTSCLWWYIICQFCTPLSKP